MKMVKIEAECVEMDVLVVFSLLLHSFDVVFSLFFLFHFQRTKNVTTNMTPNGSLLEQELINFTPESPLICVFLLPSSK